MKDPKELKVMIVAIAAALLASMGLIAALDSYVVHIHAKAPRDVLRLETVTITAQPGWSDSAQAALQPLARRI